MADTQGAVPSKNMISGMDTLLSLSGDEFVEVVRLMPDGSYKNYRTLASKLRVGKSAFDIAVENGFVGTEAEWLKTLVGESAYQTAVRLGEFTGTESEWVQCLADLYARDPETAGKILKANAEGIALWTTLTPADVGMDNLDNTADKEKPVSDPQKTEFARYVLRSRMTQEVMKVLLALPGVDYTEDMSALMIDEGNGTTKGTILRIKRGTTAQAADHTGMEGSLYIDLDLKQLYGHDGTTKGGFLLGGVSEARVQQLIDTALDAIDVAKVQGLQDALDATVKTDDVGTTVASLVDGKVPASQLPEVALTEAQIESVALALGFEKNDEGKWVLPEAPVVP
uniref:N-acetylmuramoyl-L-alanine amidase n=1 Tax=Pseudomonas phage RVTF4 TaxID=3236931 RepID=A0AB39CD32_9VIRU